MDKLSSSVVNITVLRKLFPIFMIQATQAVNIMHRTIRVLANEYQKQRISTGLMSQVKATLAFIDHDR